VAGRSPESTNVHKALDRAMGRIRAADVEMTLVHGDVTRLRASEVGAGFWLVLDTGTFHGLDRDERRALGDEVSAVASKDATVLLDFRARSTGASAVWLHPWRCRGGVPGWTIPDAVTADSAPDPLSRAFRFEELFYRLRRR
jgi:hypothetical protein